jgi:hypothetical protein
MMAKLGQAEPLSVASHLDHLQLEIVFLVLQSQRLESMM